MLCKRELRSRLLLCLECLLQAEVSSLSFCEPKAVDKAWLQPVGQNQGALLVCCILLHCHSIAFKMYFAASLFPRLSDCGAKFLSSETQRFLFSTTFRLFFTPGFSSETGHPGAQLFRPCFSERLARLIETDGPRA